MSEATVINTAEIIQFPAVSLTANPTTENSPNPVDTPVDGVVDGQLTASKPSVDGVAKAVDGVVDGQLTLAIRLAERRLTSSQCRVFLDEKYSIEKATLVLIGCLAMVRHIQPGQDARVTEIIKACVTESISYRLLTDDCKPYLLYCKILIKVNGNTHRWVAVKTANAQPQAVNANRSAVNGLRMPVNGLRMPVNGLRIAVNRLRMNPQKWLDDRTLRKAAKDPYCTIAYTDDGKPIIQKHRKPFSGELTDAEKQAIRQRDEQQLYAKLLGTKNNPTHPEVLEILKQAQIAQIQHQANLSQQQATIFLWLKVLGIIGAVAFVASTLGTGSQPSDAVVNDQVSLPQGIQQ